jgi:hypothetical protein
LSQEKRNQFLAKLTAAGLSGVFGGALVIGAIESLNTGWGNALLAIPLGALGVGLLVTAWKIIGE